MPIGLIAMMHVAPYMGAWIEIAGFEIVTHPATVAPYMGAWIEIG